MPRILLFKDPEPEEINGFKDITEAVNFLDIYDAINADINNIIIPIIIKVWFEISTLSSIGTAGILI